MASACNAPADSVHLTRPSLSIDMAEDDRAGAGEREVAGADRGGTGAPPPVEPSPDGPVRMDPSP